MNTANPSVETLLADMTLAEKIGQMAQVEKGSITPEEIAEFGIGSVLAGGGGNPTPNDPSNWASMVGDSVDAARESRLGTPLIYGVDSVHGHNNLRGATIFPHQISLGCVGDPDLVRRVARATAIETAATGVRWNFAPCVAVPHDPRWGRTYEGFGRDTELVSTLGAASVEGLHGPAGLADPSAVLACVKHFVGDGAAAWGSAQRVPWNSWWDDWSEDWQIDQGDTAIDETELRNVHLPPYRAALDAGALTVMASYSSWRGDKMHGHRYLMEDVLRREMGFGGMIVSDWMGIDQLDPDYRTCIVSSVNAGIDMVMVPIDFRRFIDLTTGAVADGDISLDRIDLAVRRILETKAAIGVFDPEAPPAPPLSLIGCDDHRNLAREVVRRSIVLLQGSDNLPIPAHASILVAGDGADDIGLQCGGWSIEWQGARGATTEGTTLFEALQSEHPGTVAHLRDGLPPDKATVGVLVAAEEPYAEGFGDRSDISLPLDETLFERMRSACERLILVIYSGRPVTLPDFTDRADAVVAAWLPGTEGAGVADVLVGHHPFEGKLSQPWPARRTDPGDPAATPRYPMGHG